MSLAGVTKSIRMSGVMFTTRCGGCSPNMNVLIANLKSCSCVDYGAVYASVVKLPPIG